MKGNSLTSLDTPDASVALRRWVGVDIDAFGREVDQPHGRDASPGVERDPVILRRGIGDLHHKPHIRRSWVGLGIEVRPGMEQGQVRLGFRVGAKVERVLDRDRDLLTET